MSKFQYYEFFMIIFNAIQACFKMERFNYYMSLTKEMEVTQSTNNLNFDM